MSTSSSTAPPSPLGECVVCGIKSTTRCSSCAKGGVDWMFFCSKDHQKLIWPVHKRVCGSPFHWPALKPEEIAEMITLGSRPMRMKDADGPVITWAERVQLNRDMGGLSTMPEAMAVEPGNVTALFEVVTKLLGRDGQPCLDNQLLLWMHFAGGFNARFATNPSSVENLVYDQLRTCVAKDPFGFLAYNQSGHLPSLAQHTQTRWYSELQHNLINFVPILLFVNRTMVPDTPPERVQEAVKYLSTSVNRLFKLARTTIFETHPEIAKSVVEVYVPAIMEAVGLQATSDDESKNPWHF